MKKLISIILLILTLSALLMAGNGNGPGAGSGSGESFFGSAEKELMALPVQKIDDNEKAGLLKMYEEEKLARDVYLFLFDKWGLQPFKNISSSEQTHMDGVRVLLNKYKITLPSVKDIKGSFKDKDLQNLYNKLTADGSKSEIDGLKTGLLIEELDIYDLKVLISKTDNKDIKLLYENLISGSENHFRAFTRQLDSRGAKYLPKYLPPAEIDKILK